MRKKWLIVGTQGSLYMNKRRLSRHLTLPISLFLLLFTSSVVSDSLWPHELQHTRIPRLHGLPEFAQTHVHWISDAIQPPHPPSSPSPPTLDLSHHQGLFQWVSFCIRWPKYWSFSFSISPSNEYSGLDWFPLGWTGSPCSPRDSQESSPTPQFKSINSSVLSFLYSPTLTSIHDYWKNHNLD